MRGAVPAARQPLGDQPGEGGHHRLGPGPVGDVLAGEGLLVHVGAQVARVGPPHPDGEFLGGQDVRGLLQGGLGRAVAAPPRVGLHRRVRGDVQHRAAAGAQQRQQQLGQRDGRDHVHLERGAQLVHRVVGQRGQRAGAQRARVVHQQVQPARGLRRPEQRGPVRGVGDVARDGGDGALDTGRGGVQVSGVPGVEDEVVALAGQAGGQRPAQSAGGPRDQSNPVVHGLHAKEPRRRQHRPRAPLGLRRWS